MSDFEVREMRASDVDGAVALQRACFPAPFPEDQLWNRSHLLRHLELFPQGQFVARSGETVIGSCSNCIISEEIWRSHLGWSETVGGPYLEHHGDGGTTLYGVDISISPDWRRKGVMRALYESRFALVRQSPTLRRYGTAVRIPGLRDYLLTNAQALPEDYVRAVREGKVEDRTLTPMLRVGLEPLGVIRNYMEDVESGNAAAILEWQP